jgi:hypothetical protein
MARLTGLAVLLVMLVVVAWRASGVMAERRLCNRRVGRSPLEGDLRRLGVPRNSEVISWKTLERLRVEAAAGADSGPRSSIGGGRWKVNLRLGGGTVTGSDPA